MTCHEISTDQDTRLGGRRPAGATTRTGGATARTRGTKIVRAVLLLVLEAPFFVRTALLLVQSARLLTLGAGAALLVLELVVEPLGLALEPLLLVGALWRSSTGQFSHRANPRAKMAGFLHRPRARDRTWLVSRTPTNLRPSISCFARRAVKRRPRTGKTQTASQHSTRT